jgi:hypothetical protein
MLKVMYRMVRSSNTGSPARGGVDYEYVLGGTVPEMIRASHFHFRIMDLRHLQDSSQGIEWLRIPVCFPTAAHKRRMGLAKKNRSTRHL